MKHETVFCLIRCVDDPERTSDFKLELSQRFRREGFEPSSGRHWSTVVRDYLTAKANVRREVIVSHIDHSTGIFQMVQYFGPGILCVVPEYMHSRVSKWDLQKMDKAWPIILDQFTAIREISGWLEENVYAPIVAGRELLIRPITLVDRTSMTQLLRDATPVDEE